MSPRVALLGLFVFASACSSPDDPTPTTPAPWERQGPHGVGHTSFQLDDAERAIQVHLFYPTAESGDAAPRPIASLAPEGPQRDALTELFDRAEEPCVRKTTVAVPDAPLDASATSLPLVVFSHCHGCFGLSSFTIAERLASHGFAVAAPDHRGDTIFEALEGENAPLDGDFLALRASDVRAVLDTLLDANAEVLPAQFRGVFDPARVGAFGHSYGAATTALALQEDDRFRSGFGIAAPMQSPVLPGPKMSEIRQPVGFLLAREDNSISELGNALIRSNYEAAARGALVEVADAGHWSFSDIAGLTEKFRAGCGEGRRHQESEPFTYLDNELARGIGAAYVTAFMATTLDESAEAVAYFGAAHPEGVVSAQARGFETLSKD